jgi:hypothetical protein
MFWIEIEIEIEIRLKKAIGWSDVKWSGERSEENRVILSYIVIRVFGDFYECRVFPTDSWRLSRIIADLHRTADCEHFQITKPPFPQILIANCLARDCRIILLVGSHRTCSTCQIPILLFSASRTAWLTAPISDSVGLEIWRGIPAKRIIATMADEDCHGRSVVAGHARTVRRFEKFPYLKVYISSVESKSYISAKSRLNRELPRLFGRSQLPDFLRMVFYALNYWAHHETYCARFLSNDGPSKGLQANFHWIINC